ncbi:MAG TPA: peptidase M61, partial [Variovorax sp.]|nr:peptidase M61 [Variovorax sp.]
MAGTALPRIRYRVACADRHAHLFAVTLQIDAPAAGQVVSLPAWIPGSYLVREFAKNLQGLGARQGRRAVSITQLDKASWQVDCVAGKALELSYEVCAYD